MQDANRRKDEFLATLAHELRNPLAPLRNGLQIMRLVVRRSGAAVEQARTMMERQLEQMVHLVDDLLDLSRISLGKIVLRKERVELAQGRSAGRRNQPPAHGRKRPRPDDQLPPETDLSSTPTRPGSRR